ncbi:hypothetical protein MAPG_10560 [Magnaporthiopsis poae ATCC 64411]|uniref:Uncharacterized protein n=1 Tax=Magnaporthiopsis poae (strain ATCC 64411 / 73-15) TaxID=644358 RepID=A0A0C4ECX1_MAGP6|nr:hypothetical protein MAPG_10560 [Magnaporthiopsis poae ATCC 64411]
MASLHGCLPVRTTQHLEPRHPDDKKPDKKPAKKRAKNKANRAKKRAKKRAEMRAENLDKNPDEELDEELDEDPGSKYPGRKENPAKDVEFSIETLEVIPSKCSCQPERHRSFLSSMIRALQLVSPSISAAALANLCRLEDPLACGFCVNDRVFYYTSLIKSGSSTIFCYMEFPPGIDVSFPETKDAHKAYADAAAFFGAIRPEPAILFVKQPCDYWGAAYWIDILTSPPSSGPPSGPVKIHRYRVSFDDDYLDKTMQRVISAITDGRDQAVS